MITGQHFDSRPSELVQWLDKLTTVQGTYLKLDPMLGGLHGDPSFTKLVESWYGRQTIK